MDFKTFTRVPFVCKEGQEIWLPHRIVWAALPLGSLPGVCSGCGVRVRGQSSVDPSSVAAGQRQPNGAQILYLQIGEVQ